MSSEAKKTFSIFNEKRIIEYTDNIKRANEIFVLNFSRINKRMISDMILPICISSISVNNTGNDQDVLMISRISFCNSEVVARIPVLPLNVDPRLKLSRFPFISETTPPASSTMRLPAA